MLCAGCGGGESPEADAVAPTQTTTTPTPAPIQAPAPIQPTYPIRAGAYQLLGGPIFNANVVVEASYYAIGQSFGLFFGCAATQTCLIPDFAATPQQSAGKLVFPDRCRFPYVFAYQGATYLACNNSDPGDGDIYLHRSTDLVTWAIQNNGQPILRRQPGTPWAHIWNVAILPVGNRWHMLAESHATLDHMDIAYAWADPTVSLDFTPNQGPVVIPNGGNPEMFFRDGKMVAIHGLFRDRGAADPWYTTMSIADPASPTAWTIRRDKLMIEQPGIDICDPTYIEVNGQGRIAVSYDQNKVLELVGPPLTVN
ncbi:hypothetical protein D3C86_1402600 [compost metagenome]